MIIDDKNLIEILTSPKKVGNHNKCWDCPLGDGGCDEVLKSEVLFDWEIRLCGEEV